MGDDSEEHRQYQREVRSINSDLTIFILESCHFIAEQWELLSNGYVFVLNNPGIREVIATSTVTNSGERLTSRGDNRSGNLRSMGGGQPSMPR